MLTSYFKVQSKRGRPRNDTDSISIVASPQAKKSKTARCSSEILSPGNELLSTTASAASTTTSISGSKKRTNWSLPENESILRKAVLEWDLKTGQALDKYKKPLPFLSIVRK